MTMDENTILKSFGFNGINDNEMRKFECWGSVEVTDRHNEVVPAEEVYKVMDIWMDRGAPIMYNHTNRSVGKGLNWQKSEKDGKPGVLITGMIYKHYKEDDQLWADIKKGLYEGLSIGGKSFAKEEDEETGATRLKNLIGYEFSVVERCGNQEATFTEVNTMAKSEEQQVTKEEPVMEEQSNAEQEDVLAQLSSAVAALTEKVAMIEEKISGAPASDEAVEEQKSEEDEPEEEAEKSEEADSDKEEVDKEEADEEDVEKTEESEVAKLQGQVSDLEKKYADLKKSMVAKTIETKRPVEAKAPKKEDKHTELNKSLDSMASKGKISFVELGKQMRG